MLYNFKYRYIIELYKVGDMKNITNNHIKAKIFLAHRTITNSLL